MTPLSFEWQWNIHYGIFMGFLYLALGIVGCGLIVAYVKTWVRMHEEDKSETQQPQITARSKYSEY
jgi:NhaP-type Na+/H+ or K+/H+ antiporter